MKRKNVSSQPLTKTDLESALKKYTTRRDLLILKSDLENKINDLEQKVDSKAQGYRDEILTKLDGVMGELQAMREENTVGTYQTAQLREDVDSHEKRIKSLEKIQPIT